MIINNYNIESYVNPSLTYEILSNKIKIGQLIFNTQNSSIEKVKVEILKEIIEFEKKEIPEKKYFPLKLTDKWLTEIFGFSERFLSPQSMTVFTSKKHNLKIHKIRDYSLGYTIKEKFTSGNINGVNNYKPLIYSVNELMDHLYLIKREVFDFTKEEMEYINRTILQK